MKNKTITSYAQFLVRTYSAIDPLINSYTLDIADISRSDLSQFASLMLQDRIVANEACGSDNREFDNTMLPSLIKFLNNPFAKNNQRDFMEAWRDGLINYFSINMQSLIDDEIVLYNMENVA